jgi:hypothetical protein
MTAPEYPASGRTFFIRDDEKRRLLSQRISDLPLNIAGSRIELLVAQVYDELEKAGISLRPKMYLSDEWGCPSGIPVVGIPFYLVDPALCALEAEMTGFEPETNAEVVMYLRHEVGHAFNYAHRLYARPRWRTTFGRFSQPYIEEYRPVPFSMRFVRHTPAWYAQKHPDDDFAETFAVWLDPGSDWRKIYENTGAMAKLICVDNLCAAFGRSKPVVGADRLDKPVEDLTMTLGDWYGACREPIGGRPGLPQSLDIDLFRLFPAPRGQSAARALSAVRPAIIREVNNWTGVDRHIVTGLVDQVIARVGALKLKTPRSQDRTGLARASIFVTALAMNYLRYGQFVPE